MRQPLSSWTRWVVAGLFAGLGTGAIADIGFLYVNGVFKEIPIGPQGINNAGQIVVLNGVLDTSGSFTAIQVPGATVTRARGLNNAAQIVGYFSKDPNSFSTDAFLYSGGAYSTFDVNHLRAFARDINDAGDIVGSTQNNFEVHGFLKVGSSITTIDVPGASFTVATGINNAGQIVGYFADKNHPGLQSFLYSGGAFSTIDVPGSRSDQANDINNAGQIVGYFLDNSVNHIRGFVDTGGVFSTIDVPGAKSTFANGINDVGDIVGDAEGIPSTLPPANVPEPGSLGLFSLGLLGVGLAVRRRAKRHARGVAPYSLSFAPHGSLAIKRSSRPV